MIVVDASAMVETLLQMPSATVVEATLTTLGQSLHAPHIIDLEIAQTLRRYLAMGAINIDQADAALESLAELRLFRYSHDALMPRIWQLRNNVTAYDAAYVALAERLDAPLLTRDARLAAAPGHQAKIILV